MLVSSNNQVYQLIHRMYTARRPLKGGNEATPDAQPNFYDAPSVEEDEED